MAETENNDNEFFWDRDDSELEEEKIKKHPQPAYTQDRHFYRVIAYSLSAVMVFSIIGLFGLAIFGKPIPEAVVALGSTAVGALAGVLAGSKN